MNRRSRTTSEPNLVVDGVSVSRLSQRDMRKRSKPWTNPEGIFTHAPSSFQKSAPNSAKLPVLHHTKPPTRRPTTATSTSSEPAPRVNRSAMLRQRVALGQRKEEQLKLEEERRIRDRLRKNKSSTSMSNLSQIDAMHHYLPKHHIFTHDQYFLDDLESPTTGYYQHTNAGPFAQSWTNPVPDSRTNKHASKKPPSIASSSKASSKRGSLHEFLSGGSAMREPITDDQNLDEKLFNYSQNIPNYSNLGNSGGSFNKRLSLERLSSYSGRGSKNKTDNMQLQNLEYEPNIPISHNQHHLSQNEAAAKIQKQFRNYRNRKQHQGSNNVNNIGTGYTNGEMLFGNNIISNDEAARIIQKNYRKYREQSTKIEPQTAMFLDEFFNQDPRNSLRGGSKPMVHDSSDSAKSYKNSPKIDEKLHSFSNFNPIKSFDHADVANEYYSEQQAAHSNRQNSNRGQKKMHAEIVAGVGSSTSAAQEISEASTLKNAQSQNNSSRKAESSRHINLTNGHGSYNNTGLLTQSFDTSFLPRLNNPAFQGMQRFSSLFEYLDQINEWDQERFEKISARGSIFPTHSAADNDDDYNNPVSETMYLLEQIINEKHALNELCTALLHTTIDLNSKLAAIETREKLALETIVKNNEMNSRSYKAHLKKRLQNVATQTQTQ